MNHQYVQPNALMNGQTSLNFPPTHHHHHHHHHHQDLQQYQAQHQPQYSSMAQCHQYMSGFQQQQHQQQQQQQYNNVYGQLQQQTTNSFQFNVEYLDSSDPQAYNDYYYGDYQYSDGYSDNLLDTGFPGTYATSTSRSTTPYGDETVEELGPEEVRWFYKVEGDKKWTPFIGYDSLRIEWKYRDLLQDVGINEARTASSPANKHPSPGTASTPSPPREKRQDSGEEKSQVVSGIVVRGGLYEVDVKHRKCESIYWEGEEYVILRGTWFYEGTWSPVEEGLADRMEQEHLTTFRGHPLSSIGTQKLEDAAKEIVHSLSVPEGEVDWFSAGEVYLSLHATPSRLMRSVGKKLGFQKTGCKLRRGYSVGASASDKPPDINHIVFVIHGIGQKMERGRIIKNCTGLRESVSHLKNKYFPSLCSAGQTVEFFPVEWRSSLVLDAGVIDNITPHKILHLRQMLNASFMDIMYYNSPLYREEIISGLTQEMNRLYTMFTCRNPYFEANGGKVSMVAHSLGCVITYDIVTGWHPARHSDQHLVDALSGYIDESESVGEIARTKLRAGLRELLCQHHHSRAQPTLNFKIENFFCLGSPLAVFLALRSKQEGQSEPSGRVSGGGGGGGVDASDLIPQKLCKRLLNIFHPSDPVAYRLEPLLCPEYANIAPILIHSHNGTDKPPYSEMPLEPIIRERESGAGAGGSATDGGRSKSGGAGGESSETATPVSSAPSTPVKGGSGAWSLWGLMKGTKKTSDAALQDLSSLLQQGKGLAERTDFVLREGSMESSYISALTSHTSYWTNYDVSHFILSILYPDILPTSSSSASVSVSSALRSDPPRTSVA
ncbi:hypothetical protein Pcinc_035702 [Petrolisthes cinctipes]|uniref:DDHD domain-containing protein n=1 Tax=Petrolisthes cinctipes TaxID=88211 RepID=A0AAE1BWF7_PETCI|nr:hypothetical protein Pcinc_035702 [Petrolisthes cinctipes]